LGVIIARLTLVLTARFSRAGNQRFVRNGELGAFLRSRKELIFSLIENIFLSTD
jgi:hypothetical protein